MKMPPPLYRIRDWDTHFENSESRKVRFPRWVAVKNKHDGAGYRRVAALPNAVEVFCAWSLILQVASKLPVRGVLEAGDGPLDAVDLSSKTGYPAAIFEAAFEALVHPKIGWLEVANLPASPEIVAQSPEIMPISPDVAGQSPGISPQNVIFPVGREGKGIEEKGREFELVVPINAPPPKVRRKAEPITEEYLTELSTIYTYANVPHEFRKAQAWAKAKNRTVSRQRFVNWLNNIPPPPQMNGAGEKKAQAPF